jgi:hypothetical protein
MAILLSKKKYTLLLGLFLFNCFYLAAQFNTFSNKAIVDPRSINSNGHSASLAELNIDWNLGDFAHAIHYSNNEISYITTGYLQNTYHTLLLKEKLDSILLHVKIGPNPFSRTINITCDQDAVIINAITLFDYAGKRIRQIKGPFAGVQFEQRIHVDQLIQAFCFVQIQFTVGNNQPCLRIYKLIQN